MPKTFAEIMIDKITAPEDGMLAALFRVVINKVGQKACESRLWMRGQKEKKYILQQKNNV